MFKSSDVPGLTVLRMNELIRPEPGLNSIDAPGPVASKSVTVIQSEQNLRRPTDRICSLLPLKHPQGNTLCRNRIPHIQAKADAQQTQLGTALHHPREKAGQFATLDEQVIGPFDLNRKAPLFKPLDNGKCQRQAQQTGVAR